MAGMIGCALFLLLRVAGCENAETIGEFVKEEQRCILKSFMARLERPALMSRRLLEKLRENYPKEYFDGHKKEFRQLSWWIHDIHYSVKANRLRELVRERVLELGDVIRHFYSGFRGVVFHDNEESPFYQTVFLHPLEEITRVSKWSVLEEAHDRIVDRTAEILVAAYPKDLFSGGVFERYRTHRDIRRVIVRDATEIIEGMADDGRLEELLDIMIEFAVEYYEGIKDGGSVD